MPRPGQPLRDLLSVRLALFTGKGGVGKSTLVAALAMELSRLGHAPLVVELGHRASLQGVLATGPIGHEPTEVVPGVHALNLDLDSALADYVTERLRVPGLGRAIVENPALARFFHAAPGVAEVATLAKIESLVRASRFSPVLVDLDATGHALMLLELPRVLEGLVGRGPLRRVISSTVAMLADRATTRLYLVTLPAELPVEETIELYRELSTRHPVPLGAVFANQVPGAPFESRHAAVLEEVERRARTAGDALLLDDVGLAWSAIRRHALAEAELDRLRRAVALPIVEVPRVPASALAREGLAVLGRRVCEALEAVP